MLSASSTIFTGGGMSIARAASSPLYEGEMAVVLTDPTVYSSFQSPGDVPVVSSDAAMSAPVMLAIVFTKFSPLDVSAKLQA